MCTLHDGSYENVPNIQTLQNFRIDKPSQFALALCLVSKLPTLLKFQRKMLPMVRCADVPGWYVRWADVPGLRFYVIVKCT